MISEMESEFHVQSESSPSSSSTTSSDEEADDDQTTAAASINRSDPKKVSAEKKPVSPLELGQSSSRISCVIFDGEENCHKVGRVDDPYMVRAVNENRQIKLFSQIIYSKLDWEKRSVFDFCHLCKTNPD